MPKTYGIELFDGPEDGKALLLQNGFVVVPRFYKRVFQPYNERPLLPPFITADAEYRTFHVLFEKALEQVETTNHGRMLTATEALLEALKQNPTNDAAAMTLAEDFFQVGRCLLENSAAPKDRDAVAGELERIRAAAGLDYSPLWGYDLDYSQFKPRGFYTKSEELRRYFRAMTWYGCATFKLASDEQTRAAIVIAETFNRCDEARAIWHELDRLYTGLLCAPDDLTVAEYAETLRALPPGLTAQQRLEAFRERAWELRDPRYNDIPLYDTPPDAEQIRMTKGMRFMGRRYMMDGGVMNAVTHPKVENRAFPTALDILAANGSSQARRHLERTEQRQYFEAIEKAAAALAEDKKAYGDTQYALVLKVMETLTAPPIEEAAPFAKTDAYADKNLMTASAVWASNRHSWILHAKQQVSAAGNPGPPDPLPGYIEPNPAFFETMFQLTAKSAALLGEADEEAGHLLERFQDHLATIQDILGRQLRGRKFTREDKEFFAQYGEELAHWQSSVRLREWGGIVADVFTSGFTPSGAPMCLEVATGGIMPIYALVEYDGVQQLTRGAVYSYYEFTQPIGNRLTDEAWRDRWDRGDVPPRPPWTRSFICGNRTPEEIVGLLRVGIWTPEAAFIEDSILDDFLLAFVRGEEVLSPDPQKATHGIWRDLTSLAVRKMPDVVKPILFERLKTKEGSEDYLYVPTVLGLGDALEADDLDTWFELLQPHDAYDALYFLIITESMTDKRVEQFWLRCLRASAANLRAGALLRQRGSKDVVPELLKDLRDADGAIRPDILRILADAWVGERESRLGPRFETHASPEAVRGWEQELRQAVEAYIDESRTTEVPEEPHSPMEDRGTWILPLAGALGIGGLPKLLEHHFAGGSWSWQEVSNIVDCARTLRPEVAVPLLATVIPNTDEFLLAGIIQALGETESDLAIPILRPYLTDTSEAFSPSGRVCDVAAMALDRILDIDPGFRYSDLRDSERYFAKRRKLIDAHCRELLELTAAYVE